MDPHEKAKEIDDALDAKRRKDAEESSAGEKIDKILECLDGLGQRFDSLSSRMDNMESRQDGAEAAQVSMTDKNKKKDAEEVEEKGEPKEMKADAYTDADRDEVAEVQTRAEHVCAAWGQEARKPMQLERADEYRRRVARPLQQHSKAWKDVSLRDLSGKALSVAVDQVFADALAAATDNNTYVGGDMLHEVRKVNRETGHVVREFYGSPKSWMSQFSMRPYRARFDMATIKRSMRGDS